MNIGRICNREVVVAQAGDPLSRAARAMCEQHVGMVVVTEEQAGKRVPVGVVTDRDIVRTQLGHAADLFCLGVAQAMTAKPLVLPESEGLVEAIEHLRARGVRRAPVVDAGGALIGVVSVDDLLAVVAEQLSGLSRLSAGQRAHEPRLAPYT